MTRRLAPELDAVLDRTRDQWEALRGARLLITGGTGFVGKWLLETLTWADEALSLGVRATVLTRCPERFAAAVPHLAGNRCVELLRGDVATVEYPRRAFSHAILAAAVAANTSAGPVGPESMSATVVDGTRRALQALRERGVERLLFVSSGAVYGSQPPDVRLRAEDSLGVEMAEPRDVYGLCKLEAESLVLAMEPGSAVRTIARPFSFVGPYLPLEHFAVGEFVRDATAGGPIRVTSDGTSLRSYLYASDMAEWLWAILLRGEDGRAYNVGSEDERTIRETAETVSRAFEPAVPVEVGASAPAMLRARYVPSTARARNELGLAETVGFEEAVRRTVEWYS